jgi:hypothetical protein
MPEKVSPLAGKTIEPSMLVNVPQLVTAYFTGKPDPTIPSQRVAFGTSGHRGSAFDNAFNEAHILAISQAICHQRSRSGVTGPLFIGIDTHALSESALASALEVFAGNEVDVMIDERGAYTPTSVISHAILSYNKNRRSGLADGIVITPSHNPPEDGGFKYNQLRLWFASMAYVLLCALRRLGLAHTQFAEATCGTIRLKLLKLGALVRVSVRRIKIAMASACPWQDEFALAHARLRNALA